MKKIVLNLLLALHFFADFIYADPSAQDEKKIARFISDVKKAMDSNAKIGDNKYELSDTLLSQFYIYDYLYFYRGVFYVLQAESEKLKNSPQVQIKLLKEATRSFALTLASSLKDKPVSSWQNRARARLIEKLYEAKQYHGVLREIEELSNTSPANQEQKIYYLASLIETGQNSMLKRYLMNEKGLFEQIQKNNKLKAYRDRLQKVVAIINESDKAKNKNINTTPKNDNKNNKENNPWNSLITNFYSSDSKDKFDTLEREYFAALKATDQKNITDIFQKNILKIHPDFIASHIANLWRRSMLNEAINLSKYYLANYKGHSKYVEMLYDLGRLEEDSAQYESASARFLSALPLFKGTDFEEQASFRLAWINYLAKKPAAYKLFLDYIEKFPDGNRLSAARYYSFKIKKTSLLNKTNNKEELENLNKEVLKFVSTNPFSFYAQLLIQEHKLSDEIIFQVFATKAYNNNNITKEFAAGINMQRILKRYQELKKFGLYEDAWQLLRQVRESKYPDELTMFKLNEYKELGSHSDFVTTAMRFVNYDKKYGNLFSLNDLFPNLYFPLITKSLADLSWPISPYVITSLIRQESVFNPNAQSVARAKGLMQLIPSTAEIVAKELKLKSYDLENPADNILMGTHLLRKLMIKYKGQLHYALSAYNAGEAVTDRWIALRGHLGPLEFIDSIPYRETTNYIKANLRNFIFYQNLYEKKPFRETVLIYNFMDSLSNSQIAKFNTKP